MLDYLQSGMNLTEFMKRIGDGNMKRNMVANQKYTIQPTYYWEHSSINIDGDSYFDTLEEAIEHFKMEWNNDSAAVIVQKVAMVVDTTEKNRVVEVE